MTSVNSIPIEAREGDLASLKTQFLASLNHEIRTPLTGILGMIDLLLETTLDSEQKEYATTVRVCAEDLLALFNMTLEFSDLASGRVFLAEEEYNLPEVLKSIVASHQPQAHAKGLRLAARISPAVPKVAVGDALRLRQMISHIVENAVKFTKQGRIEVGVSAESADGQVALSIKVRDTGIGIPADKLVTVFESFRQLDSGLAREQNGLGLGLSLVQRLTLLMGGELSVASQPGAGTTFTVVLPLRLPGEPGPVSEGSGVLTAAHGGILLVEDNNVAQRVVTHILSRRGYAVGCASSGFEAVELAGKHSYDLILMDLQMPGMDGFETSARIRQLPGYGSVPIVALTANASDDYRQRCLREGMQGFVPKPVEAEELLSAIATAIGA